MTQALPRPARLGLALAGALLVHGLALAISRSPLLGASPRLLGFAICVDLTLVVGAVLALGFGRGHRLSGLALASLSALVMVGLAHPPIVRESGVAVLALTELVVVVAVATRAARLVARLRVRGEATSLADALFDEATEALGARLGAFVATELGIVAYAFGAGQPSAGFSHHREVGWNRIASAIVLMLAVESVAVHLLLGSWNPTVAWVVTGLEVYGLVWLVGDARAANHLRTTIADGRLRLRVGLRFRCDLDITAIRAVWLEASDDAPLTMLGPGNVVLELGSPGEVHFFAWRRKATSRLALRVDDPERFVARVREAMG